MPNLLDIDQQFGEDLRVSQTGDLNTASVVERSRQRVLRRLLTAVRGYIFHLDYGAGVPARVGTVLNLAEIRALVQGQMLLEASVVRNPGPNISLQQITEGVAVSISYLVAPDRQPAALSFSVSP